jgi:hypothetical protein
MAFFWMKARVFLDSCPAKPALLPAGVSMKKGDGVNASPGTLPALVLRTPP